MNERKLYKADLVALSLAPRRTTCHVVIVVFFFFFFVSWCNVYFLRQGLLDSKVFKNKTANTLDIIHIGT